MSSPSSSATPSMTRRTANNSPPTPGKTMVFQLPGPVLDVRVCSLSLQRHNTNHVTQRGSRTAMGDNPDKQQLPLVELQPFTKKVWRREKSLPDFYDKSSEDSGMNSKEKTEVPSQVASRFIRELTETRKSIESRQNAMESAFNKYRCHPKAEFYHESNKTWRTNDLIPSFITRFERTKTSFNALQKENSFINRITLAENQSVESQHPSPPDNSIKINGGRMNQKIHRRHFMYLNPLESYRQPSNWISPYVSQNVSRQTTGRENRLSSRNSYPLSSTRAKELVFNGSTHHNYPLKPIRREPTTSPHKFNNKLGAAKNSLEVLSKMGVPTKLEKTLEKEFEMNLQRFRRDRLLLPGDLKSLPSTPHINFDNNPTLGELSLRQAREANRPKKRPAVAPLVEISLANSQENGDLGLPSSRSPTERGTPRVGEMFVNVLLHPIDQAVPEESESRAAGEANIEEFDDENTKPQPLIGADNVLNSFSENVINLNTYPSSPRDDVQENPIARPQGDSRKGPHSSFNNVNTSALDQSLINTERKKTDIDYSKTTENEISKYIPDTKVMDQPEKQLTFMTTKEMSTVCNEDDDGYTDVNSDGARPQFDRVETNIEYLQTLRRKSEPPSENPQNTHPNQHQEQEKQQQQHEQQQKHQQQQQQQQEQEFETGKSKTSGQDKEPRSEHAKEKENAYLTAQTKSIESTGEDNGENNNSDTLRDAQHSESGRLSTSRGDSQNFTETVPKSTELGEHDNNPEQGAKDVKVGGCDTETIGQNLDNVSTDNVHAFQNNVSECETVKPVLAESKDLEDEGISIPQETSEKPTPRQELSPKSRFPSINNEQLKKSILDPKKPNAGPGTNASEENAAISPRPVVTWSQQGEDDGIALRTPIENTVLDTSLTEPLSDAEGMLSASVDNGDSGVSTTFLTADDSRPEALQGYIL